MYLGVVCCARKSFLSEGCSAGHWGNPARGLSLQHRSGTETAFITCSLLANSCNGRSHHKSTINIGICLFLGDCL